MISEELKDNNHLAFLMYCHLVLVVKYRRKVIDIDISQWLKEIFEYIAPNYNITVVKWNDDIDHVHVFKGHPNTEMTKFINAYKNASSRLIKKEFPQIRTKLWKEYFGTRSFCLLTTGVTIIVIKRYIEKQGEK